MFQRFLQCAQCVALTLFVLGPALADEPVLLRYKLEKGTTLISRTKMETKTTQTINGNNIETVLGQSGIEVRVVDDLDTEGTAKLKTKIERLKANAKLGPAGDFEFDSQKTDRDKASNLGAALTPLYERLVGSELQMEVTPRGVVKSYTGYSQLVGDLVKDNPLASQFAGGGSDGAAKLSAQGQWVAFPEKAIKPGEKWDNPFEMDLPGLGVIKGKETVTLLMVENRDGHSIAKLSSSSDVSFDLKLDMGVAKVSGKITTSNSTGSAEFDVTAGKLLKQNGELTLSGQLSVEANNMTIPVQLTQVVSSENAALDKLPE